MENGVSFEIAGIPVGGDAPCFVVAEIGISHQGSLDTALRMIEAAKNAGASAVKFQKRTVDVVYTAEELAPLDPVEPEAAESSSVETALAGYQVALPEGGLKPLASEKGEEAEGAIKIEDVSNPHLKAGFDLKVTRADGSLRYVEVKGRSGEGAVEMTVNEYIQAGNHRDKYWLYVVYHCDMVPVLHRIFNPFERLIAQQTGAVRIQASQIKAVADHHQQGTA